MMLAPPAMPACSAIQPAWRPITSTTSARWCDSAVVCSRSMASMAMLTAVSKPKVKSVRGEIVVDRLGHADDVDAQVGELRGDAQGVLAADRDQRVDAGAARLSLMRSTPPSILNGLVRDEPRIVPPRGRMPRTCVDAERHGVALERAPPAVAEADELVAVGP